MKIVSAYTATHLTNQKLGPIAGDKWFVTFQYVAMTTSSTTIEKSNMICAVCREVFSSPRFLPCHHSFCFSCLQGLVDTSGSIIPCPTCRASSRLPPGGVRALQVNFYFTEEDLERARNGGGDTTCHVHAGERVVFHCIQCDQVLCIRCKLTKHEGHATEDLAELAARCKQRLEEELCHLEDHIKVIKEKEGLFNENEEQARLKKASVIKQIQARYDMVVAMARECRDTALVKLNNISFNLEARLALNTKSLQDKLSPLLQFQERARQALRSTSDMEVLQVEKGMTKGLEDAIKLEEEFLCHNTTYRPALYGDLENDTKNKIKSFIGSPIMLMFMSEKNGCMVRVGRCGDGTCREVYSLRENEDGTIEVVHGRIGDDWDSEKSVDILSSVLRKRNSTTEALFESRNSYSWSCESSFEKTFVAKRNRIFTIQQSCLTGCCQICPVDTISGDNKNISKVIFDVMYPKVNRIHNFDADDRGELFAVIDDDDTVCENGQLNVSRAVRLFRRGHDDPIATYKPELPTFFPTDVCFCDGGRLLIADWLNDCVHVTSVGNAFCRFVGYLSGSGDIVRPTALNLDHSGQLLVGCSDGWIIKCPVSVTEPDLNFTSFYNKLSLVYPYM